MIRARFDLVCVALNARNEWCADLLDPHTAKTCWLALEMYGPAMPDLFVALARASFVFDGQARSFAIRDVTGQVDTSGRYGLESARRIDDLIEAPSWLRAAVGVVVVRR